MEIQIGFRIGFDRRIQAMAMSPSQPPSHPARPSGEERVFAGADGRLWGASHRSDAKQGAVVFTCITDSRQSVRAAAVEAAFRLADATDEQLRHWLVDAPVLGKLV